MQFSCARFNGQLLLLVLLPFVLPACAGQRFVNPAVDTGNPLAALPTPSRILAGTPGGVGADFIEQDRLKLGSEFAGEFPFQRVSTPGESLVFQPDWDRNGSHDSGELAFAMFHFQLDGFSGSTLMFDWGSPPVASGDFWVGLADFTTDAWRWYDGNGAGQLDVPEFSSRHLGQNGEVLVATVLLGTDPAVLNWLRIGDNVPPRTRLAADKTIIEPGATVSFDASASRDYDGAIIGFEWDLDGDGLFEFNSGLVAAASRQYDSAGVYSAAVKATDNLGQSSATGLEIQVGVDQVFEYSFEDGWNGWIIDAVDVDKPGGPPGEQIPWGIELINGLAYDGDTSVKLWMENLTDAGKIWIERPFSMKPDTSYSVVVNFRFGTAAAGEIGLWEIISGAMPYSPETRADLFDNGCIPWDSTYNGGIPELVWLEKNYELEVSTGASGEVHAVIGLWGVFEVLQTYYVDSIRISFIEY